MHTSPLSRLGVGDGGGMNVYVRELSEALVRNDVEVDVYTLGQAGQRDVIDLRSGLRVHHIDLGTDGLRKDQLTEATARFADGVRDRIDRRGGVDVLHAHYWLSGIAGHTLKHQLGVPLVSTFHTLGRVKREAGIHSDPRGRSVAEQRIIDCSDAVVVSSGVEASEVERFYSADPTRTKVIAPGVDHQRFTPGAKSTARALLGLPESSPVVLYAGRIQPVKGLDKAVEVVHRLRIAHPDVLLVVAGGPSGSDGVEMFEDVQKYVAENGLAHNVKFVGPQPRELMPSYYRAADVCLVPSRTESFGLTALEAAACSTPVVASAVGGLQFVVVQNDTGLLVNPNDIDGFVRALSQLLIDEAVAGAMGQRAHQRAEKFSWTAAARQTHLLYSQLMIDTATAHEICVSA